MYFIRPQLHHLKLAWALVWIGLGLGSVPHPVWAQSAATTDQGQALPVYNAPARPNYGSPGGRRRGGASRGPCQTYASPTPLVPLVDDNVWGLTTAEHPAFWFYLPNSLTAETPIEFVLQDQTDNYVYQLRLANSAIQSGLIRIAPPSSAPALEVDKPYFWTLSIYCDPDRPSSSVSISGTIQRTALAAPLQSQLAAASPLERANLYAANGIWYDALSTLAELQQAEPGNTQIRSAWTHLLQQVNLAPFAAAPFVPCCQ